MKLCIGCAFYIPAFTEAKAYQDAQCTAMVGEQTDMVTGNKYMGFPDSPYTMRHDKMKCGPNADWYVEKGEQDGA